MAKLEIYELYEFDTPSAEAGEAVFMTAADGQEMFDWLRIDTIDDAARKSLRLGGHAILSSTRFSAQVSSANDGKLTLSY